MRVLVRGLRRDMAVEVESELEAGSAEGCEKETRKSDLASIRAGLCSSNGLTSDKAVNTVLLTSRVLTVRHVQKDPFRGDIATILDITRLPNSRLYLTNEASISCCQGVLLHNAHKLRNESLKMKDDLGAHADSMLIMCGPSYDLWSNGIVDHWNQLEC